MKNFTTESEKFYPLTILTETILTQPLKNFNHLMRNRTNKIPVYINGSIRHNRTGESINDKINRLKRQLGPVTIEQHSIFFMGEETIIEERDVEAYNQLGIEVYTHITTIKR